ncbi:MAG: Tad domain-containing protein [Clostridium sp.]|nr:Tad domain-containing protein [Clostridium sp.]
MNIKKSRVLFYEEKGNAMILGAFGVILAIMLMALMMDMGLYYNSYRRLKAAADTANDEISLMLPYYVYTGDYTAVFDESLDTALTNLGYSSDNLVHSEIHRKLEMMMDWAVTIETKIELQDTYHCMFAFIIGINEIPVRVTEDHIQHMGISDPYNGGPYEVWGEDD